MDVSKGYGIVHERTRRQLHKKLRRKGSGMSVIEVTLSILVFFSVLSVPGRAEVLTDINSRIPTGDNTAADAVVISQKRNSRLPPLLQKDSAENHTNRRRHHHPHHHNAHHGFPQHQSRHYAQDRLPETGRYLGDQQPHLARNQEEVKQQFSGKHHGNYQFYDDVHIPAHGERMKVHSEQRGLDLMLSDESSNTMLGATESSRSLHFTSVPQKVLLGDTSTLTLTCIVNMMTLIRGSRTQISPISLEIDKVNGPEPRQLAVLSKIHGTMSMRDPLTEGATIRGSVNQQEDGPWTLSISWSPPVQAVAGSYTCKLKAMGPKMSVVDYAYSKLEVRVEDSPGLKLEGRMISLERTMHEMLNSWERKADTILTMRKLLYNVTTLLLDTNVNNKKLKEKLNVQALAFHDVEKELNRVKTEELKMVIRVNTTEESLASTLDMQARAMDMLHKHGLSFASGIHALDIQLKELQEKLTDVRSSFNEKLGQQRRDVGQMHVVLDDVRANQSKSHTDITELGRTVQLLSQRLNNTVEKLTNLQDALGLTDGSLRLVNNGVIGKEGRLEVFYQGQWGTVCDDHFDVKAARVVCKQLGFPIENASFYEAAFYGQGNGMPIHLDDVICYGQERMLVRCSHGAWGFHGCTHAEDVGVKC